MGNFTQTFRLVKSMPSFSRGLARSIDVGNTLDQYNLSKTGNQADIDAVKSDWEAVGDDVRISIEKYAQQISR